MLFRCYQTRVPVLVSGRPEFISLRLALPCLCANTHRLVHCFYLPFILYFFLMTCYHCYYIILFFLYFVVSYCILILIVFYCLFFFFKSVLYLDFSHKVLPWPKNIYQSSNLSLSLSLFLSLIHQIYY